MGRQLYRHEPSKKEYELTSIGVDEANGALLCIYKSLDTGVVWVRSASEFFDGRFVLMTSHCLVADSLR